MSRRGPEPVTPEIVIEALDEERPGPKWKQKFESLWPAYEAWFLAEGEKARPPFLECEKALRTFMPEIVPLWEDLVELVGGGDRQARFLSLYCPPPYLTGCSQAVWTREQFLLVRNYDYSPRLSEGVILRSAWKGRETLATTDCSIGVLDGVNDAGLAVSLSFGGSRSVGRGFGAPLVLRYLLQVCESTAEAAECLRRIPTHMAYNLLVIDARGDFVTAFTSPGGPTILRRTPASTNHQDRVHWPLHAEATGTLERERRLFELLADRGLKSEEFAAAFLEAPLHSTRYGRGFGTLYTAIYWPAERRGRYLWLDQSWDQSLDSFDEGRRVVRLDGDGQGTAREA